MLRRPGPVHVGKTRAARHEMLHQELATSLRAANTMVGGQQVHARFNLDYRQSKVSACVPVNSLCTALTSRSSASALHSGAMKNCAKRSSAPRSASGFTSKW